MDLDGRKLAGAGDIPGEYPIHLDIFRARPDVGCVIHYHGMHSTAFTTSERTLKPIHLMGTIFHDGVPIYPDPRLVSNRDARRSAGRRAGAAPRAAAARARRGDHRRAPSRKPSAARSCSRKTRTAPACPPNSANRYCIDDETAASAGGELLKSRGPFRRVWALVESDYEEIKP